MAKKKKVQCLDSNDIISTLPQSLTENILTFMPIRDAVRTSILSRKWRFHWTRMTKLVFDDEFFKAPCNKTQPQPHQYPIPPSNNKDLQKYKLSSAILHVLLLHKGSILVFSLDVGEVELEMDSEFDQIIRYLSRSKNLQTFSFKSSNKYRYKLPSSFFSLQGLEVLELTNCDFKPRRSKEKRFNGYSRLKSLKLFNVTIAPNLLQTLLSSCPLLMDVYLHKHSCQDSFEGGNKFTFVEFLQCVPSIRVLDISSFYMKYLGAGGMAEKLPTSLVHLKYLYVDICLTEQDSITSAFYLMRSSPNLDKISFRLLDTDSESDSDSNSYSDSDSDSDANSGSDANSNSDVNSDSDANANSDANSDSDVHSMTFTDFQDYSGFNLDNLKEFMVENFTNKDLECEFMKLIMAKSPMLKTTRIKLSEDISAKEEFKILRDMIRQPFSCASPSAVTIVEERKH